MNNHVQPTFFIFNNSIQFKFICIALFTMQIVAKQLYRKLRFYIIFSNSLSVVWMQRYHFFRTDPIPKILSIGRYRSNPIPAQFFFFLNQCRISILLCVDLIVTLLCVKHNLLQCFSTGGSKVLGMQPHSGSRDRSEWVADCTAKRNDINSKKRNPKCFSDARLLF